MKQKYELMVIPSPKQKEDIYLLERALIPFLEEQSKQESLDVSGVQMIAEQQAHQVIGFDRQKLKSDLVLNTESKKVAESRKNAIAARINQLGPLVKTDGLFIRTIIWISATLGIKFLVVICEIALAKNNVLNSEKLPYFADLGSFEQYLFCSLIGFMMIILGFMPKLLTENWRKLVGVLATVGSIVFFLSAAVCWSIAFSNSAPDMGAEMGNMDTDSFLIDTAAQSDTEVYVPIAPKLASLSFLLFGGCFAVGAGVHVLNLWGNYQAASPTDDEVCLRNELISLEDDIVDYSQRIEAISEQLDSIDQYVRAIGVRAVQKLRSLHQAHFS